MSRGTLAVPFPTVIPEGIPGPCLGRGFSPLATWGTGRSQAMNFLLGLGHTSGGWGWEGDPEQNPGLLDPENLDP